MIARIDFLKRLLLLLVLLAPVLCSGPAVAETATPDEATRVCENWLILQYATGGGWADGPTPSISNRQRIAVDGVAVGYVFTISPQGFVVVPALKAISPIKASSDRGTLDPDGRGLASMIADDLQRSCDAFRERFGSLSATPDPNAMAPFSARDAEFWEFFVGDPVSFANHLGALADETRLEGLPLLSSTWHQGAPYNEVCPIGDTGCTNCGGVDGRTLVGCVATATAQLMFYHQWPAQGTSSHSYWWNGDDTCGNSVGAQTLSANFSDAYDWDNMAGEILPSSPAATRAAVAELCYEVGVAFEMDFGVCASTATTSDAITVLPDFFGYADTIVRETRSDYTAQTWFDLIVGEIDDGRPMLYRVDQHAIVCDGWRIIGGVNQYHLNYGWDDGATAWYTIDNIILPPPDEHEYLLRGIEPTWDLVVSATVNPIPQYGQTLLRGILVDAQGDPVANEQIEFYSLLDGTFFGGDVAPHIATTGGNGIAPVNFSPSAPPGTAGKVYARCVEHPGVQGEILLLIANPSNITLELRATMLERSDTYSRYTSRVHATAANGDPAEFQPVTWATTLGIIESQEIQTDEGGNAECTIYTEESGDVVVTATVADAIDQVETFFIVGPLPPFESLATLDYSARGIGSWSWSHDGEYIAVGCQQNDPQGYRIDIRRSVGWEIMRTIYSDESEIDGIAFSPDGSQIVAAANGAFEIYNVGNGQLIRSTENPDGTDDSRFISWNDNGVIIAEGNHDSYSANPVFYLNTNLNVVRAYQYQGLNVNSYGYTDATDKLWLNSGDFIVIYNVNSTSPQQVFNLLDVRAAAFDPSGTKIIVNRDNDWLVVFDAISGAELTQITDDFSAEIVSFDWSVHPETIAALDDDGTLWIIHYDHHQDSGYVTHRSTGAGYGDSVVKWNPRGFLVGVETTTALRFYSPLDSDGPQLAITYPPHGLETTADSITMTGWAEDPSGVDRVDFEYESGTATDHDLEDGEFEMPIPLAYGSNSICAMAFDNTLHESVDCRIVHRTLEAPSDFTVDHVYGDPGSNHLAWSYDNPVGGLVFRIYRSPFENFDPSPETLVHETQEHEWEDLEGSDHDFYRLAAAIPGVVESQASAPHNPTAVSMHALPETLVLEENFPNPFNPVTRIRFGLAESGRVDLSIYSLAGQLVTRLVDERREPGWHTVDWYGTDARGSRVSSGVYVYIMDTGGKRLSRRMTMVK